MRQLTICRFKGKVGEWEEKRDKLRVRVSEIEKKKREREREIVKEREGESLSSGEF